MVLEVTCYLNPIFISENEGIEKPAPEMFMRACNQVGVKPEETLHIGDELEADYNGASAVGLKVLLLRRLGSDGSGEHKEEGEDLTGVQVISSRLPLVNSLLFQRDYIFNFFALL